MPIKKWSEVQNAVEKKNIEVNGFLAINGAVVGITGAVGTFFQKKQSLISRSPIFLARKIVSLALLSLGVSTSIYGLQRVHTSVKFRQIFGDELPPNFEFKNFKNPDEVILIARAAADHNGAFGLNTFNKQELLSIADNFSICSTNIETLEDLEKKLLH